VRGVLTIGEGALAKFSQSGSPSTILPTHDIGSPQHRQ
jgi:hypothetical protein